ncbi:DUF3105 domain-containing protein [Lapillicoccus sp.]|uniref:DUF3105 domain-containing protein n=1 Tax=Lapillicoccus sp. TaxID=1909287 RepID=UPI0039836D54
MARHTTPPKATGRTDRQELLADLKRQQKSRERRTVLMIIAGCTALVVLLAGVITYGVIDGQRTAETNKPSTLIMAIGVPSAAASCDPPTTDPAAGSSDHVGPGTSKPDLKKVDYTTIPPSSGSHFATPAVGSRSFYTTQDSPPVEALVHNLEHGYTVLWYLKSEGAAKADQLQKLAEVGSKLDASAGKFIVAPWNDGYGAFPAGKKYALSHWSATGGAGGANATQSGHRQLCGDLSGETVMSFVNAYPKTDAPEAGAS